VSARDLAIFDARGLSGGGARPRWHGSAYAQFRERLLRNEVPKIYLRDAVAPPRADRSAAVAQREREVAILRAGGSLSADRGTRAAAIERRRIEVSKFKAGIV
jgi:hypothetical protein